MKYLTVYKLILLILALLGIMLKVFSTSLYVQILVSGAFLLLFILTALQVAYFFKNLENEPFVRDFTVVTMVIHSLCFLMLLFTYMQCIYWKYVMLIPTPFFLILFFLMFIFIPKMRKPGLNKVLIRDILLPSVFILLLGLIPVIMSGKRFYDTFNRYRYERTFEQYLEKQGESTGNEMPTY